MKRFVFIIDGVVQCRLSFSDQDPDTEMKVAGLNSSPIIIETTDFEQKPSVGWTWDGKEFVAPQ
jgi:hypothetical protein